MAFPVSGCLLRVPGNRLSRKNKSASNGNRTYVYQNCTLQLYFSTNSYFNVRANLKNRQYCAYRASFHTVLTSLPLLFKKQLFQFRCRAGDILFPDQCGYRRDPADAGIFQTGYGFPVDTPYRNDRHAG